MAEQVYNIIETDCYRWS